MNQLYKDLCTIKALIVAGWGQAKNRDKTHLCPIDALCRIVDDSRQLAVSRALYDELVATVGDDTVGLGMVEWNDAPDRTKAEVVALIQRAADRAVREEPLDA